MIVEFDKLAAGGVPDAVPEMMARSGGFNVPVDYFKKGQMPQPVPATPSQPPPSRGSRWPLYAGVAGVLAAIGIVVGIFAKSQSSSAVQTPDARPEVVAPASKTGDSNATNIAAAAVAAVPTASSKQVLLAAEPIDAHVFRAEQDLGQSPVMVPVDAGQSVELEIRRDGYKTEKVTLDGSSTREVVKLGKLARAAGPIRPMPGKPIQAGTPAKKPKSAIGGSEIVNPWGN